MIDPEHAEIIVRHHLFIRVNGRTSVAGARLHKGEASRVFPAECQDAAGNLKFDFDTADEAAAAAKKLEKYVNAQPRKPKKK